MSDKIIDFCNLQEDMQPLYTAEQFVEAVKPYIRSQFSKCFSKTMFDKTDNGHGMVFVKFSRVPYSNQLTNECVANSNLNFIISVEGFDNDGNVNDDSVINVEMFQYHDPKGCIKRMRQRRFYNLLDAKNYIKRYFKIYSEELMAEDVGAGTASGATSSAQGGSDLSFDGSPDRSEGNIAVKPYYHGIFRRQREKKKQKK